MNRAMVVPMVGMFLLGSAAHTADTAMENAVDNCIAETMAYQPEGMSDKERHVVESRIKEECAVIVYRECRDKARPLCQHFSGVQVTANDRTVPRNTIRAAYRD